MKMRTIVISILVALFLANVASPVAGAQSVPPAGDQFLVNQPIGAGGPTDIMAPSSMMPKANSVPYAGTNEPYAAPYDTSAYAPYGAYGSPYGACGTPLACSAPLAAPCVSPCVSPCVTPAVATAPFTSGFTYSASQSSAFGPFTPPVSQATEQFYQYPGLTPYGAYPGAGFSAVGGVGFDPISGYYGPYGAAAPIA